VLQRLRNPLYFAVAMAVPGIAAILFLALPQSDTWGEAGWLAFAIVIPAYVALYALAAFVSFAIASLALRRFAKIAKGRLLIAGVFAGVIYVVVGFLVDPLWPEAYFVITWACLAFVAALYVLLRWGRADG
jgi:hypothetical protein